MDLDNFIIGKIKEERRRESWQKKKQQLLNKHREEKVEVCINLNQQRQLLLT
jgi:hypothetical protein